LIKEPTTYEVEKIEPKWCRAMNEKLHALEKNSNLGDLLSIKK
jgi:hypothetical protein